MLHADLLELLEKTPDIPYYERLDFDNPPGVKVEYRFIGGQKIGLKRTERVTLVYFVDREPNDYDTMTPEELAERKFARRLRLDAKAEKRYKNEQERRELIKEETRLKALIMRQNKQREAALDEIWQELTRDAPPEDSGHYAYGLNNPVKVTDPSGHCPKPSGEWADASIICVAGFIPTATTTGLGFWELPGIYFQGDNRDFSSNSPMEASRFWLWINGNTGDIVESFAHPTQRVSGPNGELVGNSSPPRNEPRDNGLLETLYGSNSFSASLGEDGSISLDYHLVCSDGICNNLLAPNGSITFTPNEFGSYNTSGAVNVFPNLVVCKA